MEEGEVQKKREYWIVMPIVMFLFALPLLIFNFIPAGDLPQHLSQIRLLFNQLDKPDDQVFIAWFAPNTLVYFIILLFWQFATPVFAGQLALCLLLIAGTCGIFLYSNKLRQPVEIPLLASLFMWNSNLNWGFLNFLTGWPFFLLWLHFFPSPATCRRWLLLAILAYLILLSHALWFMMTCLWSVFYLFTQKRRWTEDLLSLSALLPAGIYSMAWFAKLSAMRKASGFSTAPVMSTWPWERFLPSKLIDRAFGNIQGMIEPALFFLVVAWLFMVLLTHRKDLKNRIRWVPFSASWLFFAFHFFAPDRFMNTLNFAQRWTPLAFILLILALPAPRIDHFFRLSLASFMSIALLGTTLSDHQRGRSFARQISRPFWPDSDHCDR